MEGEQVQLGPATACSLCVYEYHRLIIFYQETHSLQYSKCTIRRRFYKSFKSQYPVLGQLAQDSGAKVGGWIGADLDQTNINFKTASKVDPQLWREWVRLKRLGINIQFEVSAHCVSCHASLSLCLYRSVQRPWNHRRLLFCSC